MSFKVKVVVDGVEGEVELDKLIDVRLAPLRSAIETGHWPEHETEDIHMAERIKPIRSTCVDKRCPANRYGK